MGMHRSKQSKSGMALQECRDAIAFLPRSVLLSFCQKILYWYKTVGEYWLFHQQTAEEAERVRAWLADEQVKSQQRKKKYFAP